MPLQIKEKHLVNTIFKDSESFSTQFLPFLIVINSSMESQEICYNFLFKLNAC